MENQLNNDIETIIRDTITTVGMEIDVVQKKTGVNMMYDFIEHCVLVDSERLHIARGEMDHMLPISDYVQALTLHELGHALDRKALLESLPGTRDVIELKRTFSRQELYRNSHLLKKIIDENNQDYQFEETAWTNAERLNNMFHIVSTHCLIQMKEHGLATYKQTFLQDNAVYEGLVAAELAIQR
ncbi:Uncharacterised protein [Lysinibacillus sphaericus]|nr:Uncharacterised protein [Lysinibacillus sphaericus]